MNQTRQRLFGVLSGWPDGDRVGWPAREMDMPHEFVPSYAVPLSGFRSEKAAQICAYFALLSDGGVIDKLKLIKLVYLTERVFLRRHHIPMLFDEMYSLPHGPICSSTLNGIDEVIDTDIWHKYIAKHGNRVVAAKKFARDDLDEISDAEIAYLDASWEEFGHMTASQLRGWSHDNCPEYTETDKKRIPISYADILNAFNDAAAEQVERSIEEFRRAESILG